MKTLCSSLILLALSSLVLVGCPPSGSGPVDAGGGGSATTTASEACGIYCGNKPPEGELRVNCQAIFGASFKVVRQCPPELADPGAHCKTLPLPAPSMCLDGSIHPVLCCER